MRHLSLSTGIFAIAFGLLHSAPAWALSPETWVSGAGADSGPCTRAAPCRTFAFAFTKTSTGGTINVLTSGNFGPLTINRGVSIVADGVEAVINTAANGAAIKIQAAVVNQIFSLRGLTIDVAGSDGISFVFGAALHVHNTVIRRATNGILFAPASGTSELYLVDTVVANTTNIGINVSPTGSGGVMAVLERVRVENAVGDGIAISGSATTGSIVATVRDSVSTGNSSDGIFAEEGGAGTTVVTIDRTASVNNGVGVKASGAGATIRIGDSTVSGNSTGLSAINSAVLASYGTNKVDGNAAAGSTPSAVAMK